MAIGNLPQSMGEIAKNEAKSDLVRRYGPPSYGFLDDVLARAAGALGGFFLGNVGRVVGTARGGPSLGYAAGTALSPPGYLGGAWAGHGAYLHGLLVKDILEHPENWTVDAAGAIVPVMPNRRVRPILSDRL